MAVSLNELEKAITALNKALDSEKNDLVRDATIQRFEFCIELSWKSAKKLMGTATNSPKQVIREMAQDQIIDDVSLWLKAIDQRNLSSHTYNEELAEEVYNFAKLFFPKLSQLLLKLKNL